MLERLKSVIYGITQLAEMSEELLQVRQRIERLQEAVGRVERRQVLSQPVGQPLDRYEFQVYSQWGEDGILQYLLQQVPVTRRTFIEFGCSDYLEANTRFLLRLQNWRGLVIDGDAANIARIRESQLYWQHDLTAVQSFIDTMNINSIIESYGFDGEIGLLSIDIDGNDYWVWEAITAVSPAIVVVEYNARFGCERRVTVPYAPDFNRFQAHYSGIYYGASLAALVSLAHRKEFAFVGCNSAGNNAFFVRSNLLNSHIRSQSACEGYVRNRFRETHSADGKLSYLTPTDEDMILASLPIVETD